MSRDEITEDEIKIIKWGEKIMFAIIPVFIIALAVGAVQIRDAVAQIQTKMEMDDRREAESKEAAKSTHDAMDELQHNQNGLKIKLREMEVRQEYILDDVGDIKKQNERILDILTNNGHGG